MASGVGQERGEVAAQVRQKRLVGEQGDGASERAALGGGVQEIFGAVQVAGQDAGDLRGFTAEPGDDVTAHRAERFADALEVAGQAFEKPHQVDKPFQEHVGGGGGHLASGK